MNRWLRLLTFAFLLLAIIAWSVSLWLWYIDARLEPLNVFLSGIITLLFSVFSLLGQRAQGKEGVRGAEQEALRAHRRRRNDLLVNVRNIWITNNFHASLQEVARIQLNLHYTPKAVRGRYPLRTPQPSNPVPTDLSPLELFEDGGRSLLILGAPGAGKTFTLLELTEALLARAEQDEAQRIPVIFPLASWAEKQLSLEEWCVTELARHYGVPPGLGKAFMEQEEILPLLDGLDEMVAEARPACIRAINEFQQRHGLLGLAVCCRQEEYLHLPQQLELQTALEIQPLTIAQADSYLAQSGGELTAARAALKTDQALAELARSPLMLSIIALAYRGIPLKGAARGTVEERRARLFDAYIHRLFNHRKTRLAAPRVYLRWLKALAGAMASQNSRIFYLDDLQPSLLTQQQRSRYGFVRITMLALFLGLSIGLLMALAVNLIAGLIVGLALALLMAFLGVSQREEIWMVDRFAWVRPRWSTLREGVIIGLLWAIIFGLIEGLKGVLLGLSQGAMIVAMDVVFPTVSKREVSTRQGPNQPLKSSSLYVIRQGLVAGVTIGLTTMIVQVSISAFVWGVVVGMILAVGIFGRFVWQHFLLRAFLARSGRLPFRLVTFLDDAHNLLFLRRVGGGYRFYHALLQDHIAQLDVENFDFTGEGSRVGEG